MGIMHLCIHPILDLMNIPQELRNDAYAYVMIIVDGSMPMMGVQSFYLVLCVL